MTKETLKKKLNVRPIQWLDFLFLAKLAKDHHCHNALCFRLFSCRLDHNVIFNRESIANYCGIRSKSIALRLASSCVD